MKEATGELNMTVITVIAVVAIGLLFYLVIWPMVQSMIVQQTCNTYGPDWKATRGNGTTLGSAGAAEVSTWKCCKGNTTTECVDVQ